MLRIGYTNEQIFYGLRQEEGGKKVGEVCLEIGVSEATFYFWPGRRRLLAESHLAQRLFGAVLRRIESMPLPAEYTDRRMTPRMVRESTKSCKPD